VVELQQGMEEFLDYALSHNDTRVVSAKQFLEWMRDPVALTGNPIVNNDHSNKSIARVTVQRNRVSVYFSEIQTGDGVKVRLYTIRGQLVSSATLSLNNEKKCIWTIGSVPADGIYILKVNDFKKMVDLTF
jgi:hypothetical protein